MLGTWREQHLPQIVASLANCRARVRTHPADAACWTRPAARVRSCFTRSACKLAAAEAAGLTRGSAVAACVQQVRGLDVHPVAVIIARVTWLLALGPAIEERIGELHVPVYLGDAMQWNLRQVGDTRDVIVPVPDDTPLYVPAGFAEDQARFDYGLQTLTHGLHDAASPAQVERSLLRMEGIAAPDAAAMADTYKRLRELVRHGAQWHLAICAAQSDAAAVALTT